MPWSALPPHIDEPHEWDGKDDDDHWYTSWKKQVKGWFAFGPRCTEWWAKTREYPAVLFKLKGKKEWRWETDPGPGVTLIQCMRRMGDSWYLSRVQKWTPWHIALQWPLFFSSHVTIRGTVWQFYIGMKRDADRVFWVSLFFGKGWK